MPDEREWVVMLRARSTIRLRDDPHVVINPAPGSTGPVLGVRVRNTFSKVDDDRLRLLVTGLFVEARGTAASPDSAVEQLTGWALSHLQVIATAGNGAIDEPADLVVYAPPADKHPGRFLERRSCGPKDPAVVVRSIGAADLLTVLHGLRGHVDEQRLQRAMAHYRHALAELDPFNRVTCAESLFMACENLGHVVLRRLYREAQLPDNGRSKHKLAVDAGFNPPNERSNQHLTDFDSYVRAHYVFDDEKEVYDNLKFASDHFEHGSRGFDQIQAAANASADKAFGHVRRAILREIGVPNDSPLVTEEKYQHPLAGWQPALEVSGSYTSDRDDDWPNFYEVSLFPEILDIEDLDDDQKRKVTFRFTGSGAALLGGQQVTLERSLWALPFPPDRKAEQGSRKSRSTDSFGTPWDARLCDRASDLVSPRAESVCFTRSELKRRAPYSPPERRLPYADVAEAADPITSDYKKRLPDNADQVWTSRVRSPDASGRCGLVLDIGGCSG